MPESVTPSNPLVAGLHFRGQLPHLKKEGAVYFVTFRLADSLPAHEVARLKHERQVILEQARAAKSPLTWHEEEQLLAWVVTPNHVHVVVWPMPGHTLSDILHSWKSFTSKAANKLLGRTGEFWQKESFDHWIRDEAEHVRLVAYVENNPVKARLCKSPEDWKWGSASKRRQTL